MKTLLLLTGIFILIGCEKYDKNYEIKKLATQLSIYAPKPQDFNSTDAFIYSVKEFINNNSTHSNTHSSNMETEKYLQAILNHIEANFEKPVLDCEQKASVLIALLSVHQVSSNNTLFCL